MTDLIIYVFNDMDFDDLTTGFIVMGLFFMALRFCGLVVGDIFNIFKS